MSLSTTIDAMVEAGCSAEQIAAVVRRHEQAIEVRAAARREKDAARKRASRVPNVTRTSAESEGQGVTSQDTADTVSLKVSPNDNINSNPHPNSHPSVTERDAAFDRLRQAYPRRSGSDPRKPALAKFQAAVKRGVDPEAMIAGAAAYARFQTDPKFVKQLANWITAECWTENWDSKPKARAGPRNGETNGFHTAFNETQRHEPDYPYQPDPIASASSGLPRLEHDYRALPRQTDTRGRGPLLDLEPTDAEGRRV